MMHVELRVKCRNTPFDPRALAVVRCGSLNSNGLRENISDSEKLQNQQTPL